MNGPSFLSGATSSPPARRRLLVGLYILLAFLFWFSLYLYMPTLPTYAQGKVQSLALVGLILAQYGLWQAIVRLPLGIASDWAGRRKPFILAGFLLAGLGAWVMGSAGSAAGLFAGRAITGLACGAWVPLTVAFSGLFPPQEAVRAAALLTVASNSGRIIATSATGALNGLGGYPLAFNIAAGVAVLTALALLVVPESRRQAKVPSLRGLGAIARRREVLIPSLLQAVAQYASWAVPLSFVPILARQMGASDGMQSLLMSLNIAVVTAGGLVTAAVAPRLGGRRMAHLSFVILAIGICTAALAPSLGVLFLAQGFLGLALGIGYPVLMGLSIERVGEVERATAMGLHQAIYAIGMFAGPSLSGVLAEAVGIRPMFGITGVGCLGVALLLLRLLRGSGPERAKPQNGRDP